MTAGLLVIDKPAGITSFAVVAKVRRATSIKKVGHAGTLDPLATGVLVVALAQATRLIRYIQDGEKEYVATIQFGIGTDTLDAGGVETERYPMNFGRADLDSVLDGFRGEIEQVPPMVSALKIGGERLYDLARAGVEVDRTPRQVRISALEVIDFLPRTDHPVAVMRVVASKGTYIRSLADDIARNLGGRAHLTALRRRRVGMFHESDAVSLEALEGWRDHLQPLSAAVGGLDRWNADDDVARSVRHGRAVAAPSGAGPWAIFDGQELLGVYRREDEEAVAEVVLA